MKKNSFALLLFPFFKTHLNYTFSFIRHTQNGLFSATTKNKYIWTNLHNILSIENNQSLQAIDDYESKQDRRQAGAGMP